MNLKIGSMAVLLALALAGCGGESDADRTMAENLTIQPGKYDILAERNGKAEHSDLLMPDRPVEDYFKSDYGNGYLGILLSRLCPSVGSHNTRDYPETISEFKAEGGSFTAKGDCYYRPGGWRAKYAFEGRNYVDGFVIDVVHTGHGTTEEGVPDKIQVRADKRVK